MTDIETVLSHATQTRALCLGSGVLEQVADVFKSQFPNKKAIVVADIYSFEVAGRRVCELLERDGVEQEPAYIFQMPEWHAEWKYIEQLESHLAQTDTVAIAVGSGTINDTVKLSSYHLGRPYMVVTTAVSMDGYVAFGASITKDGAKQTFPCSAPAAVLADVVISATAPKEMTASGYADLLAKVPAGADWILADALGIEPIDPTVWGIVQDGLHEALSDPEGARNGDLQALTLLTEGLMFSGFAMQAYPKSSRPASGADHQFSHLLNMQNFVMQNGRMPSHGFQVSIGLLVSLALYDQLMQTDVASLDVDRAVANWPSLEETQQDALGMFKDTDFPTLGATELAAKYVTPEQLRAELERFKATWPQTKERLRAQLITPQEAIRMLKAVGAPVNPEDIDLPRKRLRDSIIPAQRIRRRYTILDLGLRTGWLDEWTARIFGPDGLWPIA